MKNEGFATIGEVIRQMFAQSPHKHKLAETALICAWKEIMPLAVRNRTERIFTKEGKLFVQLSSAPLKHSLQMNKDKILQRLAAQGPDCKIKDLIFL